MKKTILFFMSLLFFTCALSALVLVDSSSGLAVSDLEENVFYIDGKAVATSDLTDAKYDGRVGFFVSDGVTYYAVVENEDAFVRGSRSLFFNAYDTKYSWYTFKLGFTEDFENVNFINDSISFLDEDSPNCRNNGYLIVVILEVKNNIKDRVSFAADLEKEELGISFSSPYDPGMPEAPGAEVEIATTKALPQIDPGMPEAPGAE